MLQRHYRMFLDEAIKQEISAKVLLGLPCEFCRDGTVSIYRNLHHLSFLQNSLFHYFNLISFSSHFHTDVYL